MRRYILAAGFAASEVGALMALWGVVGFFTGVKSAAIWVDITLILGLGAWLWLRRSLIAAVLMLLFVAFEYVYLASTSGAGNSWLTTYLILFIVAALAHGREPKATEPRGPKGE